MPPPTNPTPSVNQRVEELEEVVGNLESRVSDLISKTVEKEVGAMKNSLAELMLQGQKDNAKKHNADMELLANRIFVMKNDQEQFQSEIRSTLTGLPSGVNHMLEKGEGSISPGESSVRGFVRTATMGVPVNGLFGSPGGERSYHGGSGFGGGYGGGNWRYRKLDMPLFDGYDPDGWVLRVERYFDFYKLTEQERLDAVVVALEGDALKWFQWENRRRPIRRWDELKGFLLRQFRSASGGSLYEQWLSTNQTHTVAEYQRKFIETAAPLKGLTEEILLGQFLTGLKEEIRVEVRILNPINLEQAMEFAVRIEEKNRAMGLKKNGWSMVRTGTYSYSSKGPAQSTVSSYNSQSSPTSIRSWASGGSESQMSGTGSKQSSVAPSKNTGEMRRLSEKELQEKRAKGLCFRCDEKWNIGHRCKRRELSVLLIDDGEEDYSEGTGSEPPPSPTEELTNEVTIHPEVSLNSVVGLSNPRTMKLRGKVGESEVVVLIDPGATHNFVSLDKVAALKLPVTDSGGFGVSLGNGEAVRGNGVCENVILQLDGGVVIQEDFLPLKLGTTDIILGIQWLEKLGAVVTNWKSQIMQFNVGENTVTLVGDPSLVHSQTSLKTMLRTMRKERQGCLVEVKQIEDTPLEINQQVTTEIPKFISTVVQQHRTVFNEPKGLPPSRGHEHVICLKEGSNPVSVRPYRYPQFQKDEIERLIKEMLEAKIIKPSSSSFSSPVLLVRKKDGSWHFCVDYRALNKETVPNKYPIPIIDELLDELHGSKFFSKLDLKAGYHQILVRPEDTHKTAFRTHDGHYEFLVMPFGLMNAPATFQSLMNDIFRPCLRRFVLVFFDDILIYSKTEIEHQEHLHQVLSILEQHHLVANLKKCVFGQQQVAYLGHVISNQGVAADGDKIRVILDWAVPKNLRELRGFLGLTGYYRKYVLGYAQIARPLTDQLRKDRFGWNDEATAAFNQLKQAMETPPVLAMPDFTQRFVVETDASGFGLGAVLMQHDRPIAFYSKLLGPKAQQKSIYEKELMAICFAMQKWRCYLLGRHFVVRTDQQSLRYILQQREIGNEYQRWLSKLMSYSFEVHYKPGKANLVADALSRKTVQNVELGSLLSSPVVDWTELINEVK